MTRWLSLAILAVPLAVLPGFDLAETKNLALLALGAGLLIGAVRNPWVRAFGAWALVATGAAAWARAMTGAAAWPPWALLGVLGLLAWMLCYHHAAGLTEATWRKVRAAVVASAALQVLWVGLQARGLDPLFSAALTETGRLPDRPPLHGWMANPMDLALYLGVSLPLLAAVHPLLMVLTALAMAWWLPTTVGTMAISVTTLWMLGPCLRSWLRRGVALALVGGAALGYLTLYDPQGAGGRPRIWRESLALIAERPWIGWGANAIDHQVILLMPRTETRWNFLFNEWLQAAVEFGVVAPVLAAGYLVTLARRLRFRLAGAGELVPALVIVVAASLFSIPFRIGPVALLAALVCGRLDAVAGEASA